MLGLILSIEANWDLSLQAEKKEEKFPLCVKASVISPFGAIAPKKNERIEMISVFPQKMNFKINQGQIFA